INILNEKDMSPFLWALHKKPLNRSLLNWLAKNGGRPKSDHTFCKFLRITMLTKWDDNDLKYVAALFYHYKIKVTELKCDQFHYLHEYIAKNGIYEPLEKMFTYFWDCYNLKIMNQALVHAK
ncbi:24024_t:CDS:1, partial [Racocetra persica]